jgi:hypothetical protein
MTSEASSKRDCEAATYFTGATTFKVLPSEIRMPALSYENQDRFSADVGIMTFRLCASYSVHKLATLTQALTTLDSLSAQPAGQRGQSIPTSPERPLSSP